jgi:hypothetical protein
VQEHMNVSAWTPPVGPRNGACREREGRGEELRLPGTVQAGRAGNRHRRRSGRHRDGDYRACGIRIHA